MPRSRKRKTNRVRQEDRRLRVRGVRRGAPDTKKLARAFINLAMARAEAQAQAQMATQVESNSPGVEADDDSA